MRTELELEFQELNENIEWSETNEGRKAQGTIYVSISPSLLWSLLCLFALQQVLVALRLRQPKKRKKSKAKQSQAKPSQGRKWMEETNLNQSKQNQTKPFLFSSFCSLHLSHPPTITSSQVTQIFSLDPDRPIKIWVKHICVHLIFVSK